MEQIIQQFEAQRADLTSAYLQALTDTMSGNQPTLQASALSGIAAAEAEAFINFLSHPEPALTVVRGGQLCDLGVGKGSVLRLGQVTRRFAMSCLDDRSVIPALEAAEAYHSALLGAYMERREQLILKEQEEARTARPWPGGNSQPFDDAQMNLAGDAALGAVMPPANGPLGDQSTVYLYELNQDSFRQAPAWSAPASRPLPLDLASGRTQFQSAPADTMLSVPLRLREQQIGMLDVYNLEAPRPWTENEVALVTTVAEQTALALENAQLYASAQQELAERQRVELELERRLRETLLLNRVIATAATARDPKVVLQTVCDELAEYLHFQNIAVGLLDELNTRLTILAGRQPLHLPSLVGLVIPTSDNPLHRYVIENRVPLIIEDTAADERAFSLSRSSIASHARSIFVAPLIAHERVVGLISMDDSEPHHTSADEVALVQNVASTVSQALENARLFDTVQRELAERKRSEEIIRRQNAYLNALQETTVGLIKRLDVEELLQAIVARASALLGTEHGYVYLLTPDEQEIQMRVGIGLYSEFVGTRAKPAIGLAGRVWQTGEPINVADYRTWEHRLPDPRRDILRAVIGVPLKSGERVIGVLGLAHTRKGVVFGTAELDVLNRFTTLVSIALDNAQLYAAAEQELAERKRAEQTLAAERSLLRTIIDSTPDWIFIKDREHRFRLTNQGYANSLRLKPEDLIDKTDIDLGFPEDMVKGNPAKGIVGFWSDDAAVMESRQMKIIPEEPIIIADELRYLSTVKVPLVNADGAVWGVLGFVHDITNLKRVEETLARERTLLRTLIDAIPDYVYAKDTQSRFVMVNPAVAKHLGASRSEEIIGKTDFDYSPPGLSKEYYADEQRIFQTGQGQLNHEQIILDHETHSERWVATTKVPLRDSQGQIVGLVGINRDITESKRAALAIEHSLREKEVLLTEIHHRVKNNLQVISSLLNLQAASASDPKVVEVLRDSQMRVRSMALVHEKLYQSKDLAHVDFDGYVRNLSSFLLRSFGASALNVTVEVNIADVFLSIDRAVPCGLIINELVSNALKYAFPGQRPGQVRIELLRIEPSRLILTVSDNGIGLPPGLDFRNTESLGMQLVNTLTDQMGGIIEQLQEGGTSFRITFPL